MFIELITGKNNNILILMLPAFVYSTPQEAGNKGEII